MELFIATILVAVGIAVYLTSLVCRRSVARSRRPALWPAAVASLCGPVIIILASEGVALFTRRFWQGTAKGEPLPLLIIFVCICAVASIIPAMGVVAFYKRRVRS